MPVAAAAAQALKKRNKSNKEKKELTFPTPARHGWGQVSEIHSGLIFLLYPFIGCSSDKPQDGPGK